MSEQQTIVGPKDWGAFLPNGVLQDQAQSPVAATRLGTGYLQCQGCLFIVPDEVKAGDACPRCWRQISTVTNKD